MKKDNKAYTALTVALYIATHRWHSSYEQLRSSLTFMSLILCLKVSNCWNCLNH